MPNDPKKVRRTTSQFFSRRFFAECLDFADQHRDRSMWGTCKTIGLRSGRGRVERGGPKNGARSGSGMGGDGVAAESLQFVICQGAVPVAGRTDHFIGWPNHRAELHLESEAGLSWLSVGRPQLFSCRRGAKE